MIEMLISGHADPAALAELVKGRMRSKIPALTEAMESRWRPHYTVVARRIMAHIDFLDSTIAELSDEIVERLRPLFRARSIPSTEPILPDQRVLLRHLTQPDEKSWLEATAIPRSQCR